MRTVMVLGKVDTIADCVQNYSYEMFSIPVFKYQVRAPIKIIYNKNTSLSLQSWFVDLKLGIESALSFMKLGNAPSMCRQLGSPFQYPHAI